MKLIDRTDSIISIFHFVQLATLVSWACKYLMTETLSLQIRNHQKTVPVNKHLFTGTVPINSLFIVNITFIEIDTHSYTLYLAHLFTFFINEKINFILT